MPPERLAHTYGPGVTSASRAVLLELMALLRAYQEALVLVGGWVPYFLLERERRPDDGFIHVGSIDIDVAVDPAKVSEAHYATIVELLTSRGYRPATDRRGGARLTSYERSLCSPATGKPYTIRVDFLTSPVEGTRPHPPHLAVQDDLLARKMRGCEAAFRHQTVVRLSGALPEGGTMTVPIRMADVVGLLTMKGIVLGERYREKDAYDIYALAAHYQRGPRDVASLIRPHLEDPLVREAMASIRDAFARREAHGPAWVAAFLVSPVFAAERERLVTEAFMVVSELTRHVFAPASTMERRGSAVMG